MKVHELFKLVAFEGVRKTLLNHYDEKNTTGYENMFSKLITMKPKESEDKMRVLVEWYEPDPILDKGFEEKGYWHVYGKNGKKYIDEKSPEFLEDVSAEYKNFEVSYALDFTSWDEWLGMEVDEISYEKLTYEEVCAHILWEMTFHGFENSEIIEKRDELLKRVDDIKEGRVSGEHFVNFDEFRKSLEDGIEEEAED